MPISLWERNYFSTLENLYFIARAGLPIGAMANLTYSDWVLIGIMREHFDKLRLAPFYNFVGAKI